MDESILLRVDDLQEREVSLSALQDVTTVNPHLPSLYCPHKVGKSGEVESLKLKTCPKNAKAHRSNSNHYIHVNDSKCWKKPRKYSLTVLSPICWKILGKVLGISQKPKEKPWLATLLHLLTVASALTYMISRTWFVISFMKSSDERNVALKYSLQIVLSFFWGLLSIYANKLAYRMFTHQGFVKNIRLHSKTILKCNAACVIIVTATLFIVLLNYSHRHCLYPSHCEKVNLEGFVCPIIFSSMSILSFFGVLWNVLVSIVVLSVCRTHALQIRHFIRELERDAMIYDDNYQRHCHSVSTDVTELSQVMEEKLERDNDFDNHSSADESLDNDLQHFPKMVDSEATASSILKSNETNLTIPLRSYTITDHERSFRILKPSEILHRYWKLQCALRLSSGVFKRWMLCEMILTLIWSGLFLVSLLKESPSVLSILLFILPLIWLPTLTSAIAEVNHEGQRMRLFICPLQERLRLLMFLNDTPLQMTLYGFSIKHSTVVTSVFGIVAALMSGIILQELKAL